MTITDSPRIAKVISAIQSASMGKMISVKDAPLTVLFNEQKIYSEDRMKIMDYLKERLIFHEGARAGMKYMWKGDFSDSEKIAEEIVDYYSKNEPLKYRVTETTKKKSALPSLIHARNVGDKGYILYNNHIYEAYVYSAKMFPNEKAVYDVLITEEGVNKSLSNMLIFPTVALLVSFVQNSVAKFNPDAELAPEEF